MPTIINKKNQNIVFVGNNQPQVIINFDSIEKLAVEADAIVGQKVGRIYYHKPEGVTAWVSIVSPENFLADKMNSLAAMVKECVGKDVPVIIA